jgi:hypothetical protein
MMPTERGGRSPVAAPLDLTPTVPAGTGKMEWQPAMRRAAGIDRPCAWAHRANAFRVGADTALIAGSVESVSVIEFAPTTRRSCDDCRQ